MLHKKVIENLEKQKANKVIDITAVKKAKARTKEMNLKSKEILENQKYDSSYKIYLNLLNIISYVAKDLSVLEEFHDYISKEKIVKDKFVNEKSPLTELYLSLWEYFDLVFGINNETMGKVFKNLMTELQIDIEEEMLTAVDNLNQSYMGIYLQTGIEDDFIILKEILTNKIYRCIIPSGYKGSENEIWYVRLSKNLDNTQDYYIAMNTPYIILNTTEEDWKDFFKRNAINKENMIDFFKNNQDLNYWHNFIMNSFVKNSKHCIFLNRIPEIKNKE